MIYYVEDDDNIRELVIYTLSQMGMPAKGFAESAGFLAALKKELPDLVLLDVMLPGEDGLFLLRRLRADVHTAALPVIMLTAKGAEFDKVQGLDLGADDYITKPFGMAELIARIRARLRRSAARPAEDLLTHGDLHIDKRAHRVFVCNDEKTLTIKEYELLLLLMENSGAAFTREQLLDMQESVKQVTIHPDIAAYSVDIVEMTRKMEGVQLGVSPRGNLALLKAAQALAAINGRSYVIPDDIKDLAVPVLGHRIILRGSQRNKSTQIVNLIQDILESVEVPTEDWKNVKQEG